MDKQTLFSLFAMYLFVCEKSDEIGRDREHSERKKKLRIQGKKRKRKIAEQRIEKGKMNKKKEEEENRKCVVLCCVEGEK